MQRDALNCEYEEEKDASNLRVRRGTPLPPGTQRSVLSYGYAEGRPYLRDAEGGTHLPPGFRRESLTSGYPERPPEIQEAASLTGGQTVERAKC